MKMKQFTKLFIMVCFNLCLTSFYSNSNTAFSQVNIQGNVKSAVAQNTVIEGALVKLKKLVIDTQKENRQLQVSSR